MKAILVGLWVAIVSLGSAYGAAMYWPTGKKEAAEPPAVLQHQKTRVLNVPIVSEGAVQGFMAMQFEFTMEAAALRTAPVPPEVYLLDEAFRTVYADSTLDFHNLQKYDIGSLTKHLVSGTNARLGAPLIKDVLIVDFSYIPKELTQ